MIKQQNKTRKTPQTNNKKMSKELSIPTKAQTNAPIHKLR